MNDFVKRLQDYDDFMSGRKGATDSEIQEAEKALGLSFSKEYREYTGQLGIATADGHEFTGIAEMPRLNVVHVTKSEKRKNSGIPENFYVVERVGIDGIVIWQDQQGNVYEAINVGTAEKIAESLAEYLDA